MPASGFDKLLESIFWLLLVVEAFSLQKVVRMLKEVVVGWWEVRWTWANFGRWWGAGSLACRSPWDRRVRHNWVTEQQQQVNMADEAKLCSQICLTFEASAVRHAVRRCPGEELGPFCWSVPAVGVAFSVHLIDLLSTLLRGNDFAEIQKAVVDQTSRSPPNRDHDLLLVHWLWEVLWSCFLVQPLSWLSYKIHLSPHVTVRSRNGSLLRRIRLQSNSSWICV